MKADRNAERPLATIVAWDMSATHHIPLLNIRSLIKQQFHTCKMPCIDVDSETLHDHYALASTPCKSSIPFPAARRSGGSPQ